MDEGILLNDRYQLIEKLGSGGMADVFRARDLMLDRYVAIKVLRQDYSINPEFQNHFKMEARSAAMELVPGKDLKQLIRERGRFTVEQGIPLVIQACAGLGYAHRAGLVHCDVKPHNMLVAPDGRLKVTDFGIARALATMTPGERTDVVWGSPLYFAPEQAQGEAPSPASDVYSLGVSMYELFSGTTPFTASTPDELARLHISARPIPIREYIPEIPAALEQIISKVLSKEPAARYRTADQLGRVLQKFGTAPDELMPAAVALTTVSHPIAERLPTKDRPSQPRPEPVRPLPPPPEPELPDSTEIASAFKEIDWVTVGLSLLAVIAVGGLIPFWMMVYFAWNPIAH